MSRFLFNLKIALEALMQNKMRSLLTALGIIFGVASVIAMLAIGTGAEKEVLDQIKLVGVNNIIIKQKIKVESKADKEDNTAKKDKKEASLGLTINDGEAIKKIVPNVTHVSPELDYETFALRNGISLRTHLVGIKSEYFDMFNLKVATGQDFNNWQMETGDPVCIIGKGVQTKFFSSENAIGKEIKCGHVWFTVIGVLENRNVNEGEKSSLGIRDNNLDIYAPIQTLLLRYDNRALITRAKINKPINNDDNDNSGKNSIKKTYNQIDKLIVQVSEPEILQTTANFINTMLKRRHNNTEDFEIDIPQDRLNEHKKTKNTFKIVLTVIAGISLMVGGIGIMNIMLVSVMERLKEIGLRMAVGATKKDIILQFLAEAILMCLFGGIAGILIGIIIAKTISGVYSILTIITISSIVISFGVAISVGIIFGIAPARKAAAQDPIESLRHE